MLGVFQKPLTYKLVNGFTAFLCLYLFAMTLCTPRSFPADVGLRGNEASDFLSRRASMFLLGISVLAFQSRRAIPSIARQAIVLSIATTMGGLAVLGFVEFLRGSATATIFGPVCIEAFLCLAYGLLWFGGRAFRADRIDG
jgi:cation transporter-like permease